MVLRIIQEVYDELLTREFSRNVFTPRKNNNKKSSFKAKFSDQSSNFTDFNLQSPELFGDFEYVNSYSQRVSQAVVTSEKAYFFIIPVRRLLSRCPQMKVYLETKNRIKLKHDYIKRVKSSKNQEFLNFQKKKASIDQKNSSKNITAAPMDKWMFHQAVNIFDKQIPAVLIDLSTDELIQKSQKLSKRKNVSHQAY